MSDADFRKWMNDEVAQGRWTFAQRDDLLQQKDLFDANRAEIESQHNLRIAGYATGRFYVTDSMQDLFEKVEAASPGRVVYFETIGFSANEPEVFFLEQGDPHPEQR